MIQKPFHNLTKLGFVLLGLGIIGLIVTSVQINKLNQDQNVYGLADASTLTCDKIDFLNDFFDSDASNEGCENDGGSQTRNDAYQNRPLLQNLQVASGVTTAFGLLAIFAPGLLKLPEKKTPRTRNDLGTIEERLAKIEELKDTGLISDEEYASLRRKVLEGM